MYFPWNCELGSAVSKLRNNVGGGFKPPGYASEQHIGLINLSKKVIGWLEQVYYENAQYKDKKPQ
jgi:hypothetical protein